MSAHDETAWSRVGVVVVTYNSAAVIGACLDAIGPAAEVVVVDNASSDSGAAVVARHWPGAKIVVNPDNRGYGTACNQGMARLTTEFGLTLNPDTILEPGTVERLVAEHDAARAGVVAPVLYAEDGTRDLPVMGPDELTHSPADPLPEGPFCTWYSIGAVWLCRMEAWRAVGGFDETILLYGDDADLSIRMTRAGWPLVVLPDLSVRHLGGKSSPPSIRNRARRDWHMTWSHFYLLGKHGDAAGARAQARAHGWAHVGKALKYMALLNPKYVIGNAVKAHAAFCYAAGRMARQPASAQAAKR